MEACSRLVGTSRVGAAFSVDAGLSEYDCGGGDGGAFTGGAVSPSNPLHRFSTRADS